MARRSATGTVLVLSALLAIAAAKPHQNHPPPPSGEVPPPHQLSGEVSPPASPEALPPRPGSPELPPTPPSSPEVPPTPPSSPTGPPALQASPESPPPADEIPSELPPPSVEHSDEHGGPHMPGPHDSVETHKSRESHDRELEEHRKLVEKNISGSPEEKEENELDEHHDNATEGANHEEEPAANNIPPMDGPHDADHEPVETAEPENLPKEEAKKSVEMDNHASHDLPDENEKHGEVEEIKPPHKSHDPENITVLDKSAVDETAPEIEFQPKPASEDPKPKKNNKNKKNE